MCLLKGVTAMDKTERNHRLAFYATNYLEDVTVTLIAPTRTITNANVEYCIASGYVKINTPEESTLITHISNVVIEVMA